jgi:hypothetical protein
MMMMTLRRKNRLKKKNKILTSPHGNGERELATIRKYSS